MELQESAAATAALAAAGLMDCAKAQRSPDTDSGLILNMLKEAAAPGCSPSWRLETGGRNVP